MTRNILVAEAKRYEVTVPDTLDLAERAALAINGLCGTVDPDDDYMQYFHVYLNARQPYLQHSGCDVQCTPKFADALPRLRAMSGSDRFTDIECGMREALLSYLAADDGLYYALYTPKRPWHGHVYGRESTTEDLAQVVASGIMMSVLMMLRELSNKAEWDERIEKLAWGQERIAVCKNDYAYYPVGGPNKDMVRPRSGWLNTEEPGGEGEAPEGIVTKHGYTIQALAKWAALTGDERALEFAGKLARFVMKPHFWRGVSHVPQISAGERGHPDRHFHAMALAAIGVLEYGLAADDRRACDFARSSYEYMRIFGIPELGFIPTSHNISPASLGYMEGCFLRDALWLAIKLSEAGYGDFWEDVDRIVRNQLVEAQFIDKGMLERIAKHSPERTPGPNYNLGQNDERGEAVLFPGEVYAGDDVIDRALGIFGSSLGVNSIDNAYVGQCCSPNAARGLSYAWDAIARCEGEHARVNLFLNRAAPWLDIDSYLPHQGRVVIRNKSAKRISVRIPPWVRRSELDCRLDGEMRNPLWIGTFAMFGELKPHDVLEIRFPIGPRTFTTTAHAGTDKEKEYSIRVKGNTVLEVSPEDQSPRSYQFYRREHMTGDLAPMKTVTRYVAPVVPGW